MSEEHVCSLVRCINGAQSSAPINGWQSGYVSTIAGKRLKDARAGEGRVRRDRLLPEDQPLQPRAKAIPIGLPRAGSAIRRLGLNPKNRKEPFEWAQVVKFAEAYGSRQQGYCHLVVASIGVIMFGGMCRYDDASGLMWRNIHFEADGSAFEITFVKRKNSLYRQGNKVLVTTIPNAAVCPVRML